MPGLPNAWFGKTASVLFKTETRHLLNQAFDYSRMLESMQQNPKNITIWRRTEIVFVIFSSVGQ